MKKFTRRKIVRLQIFPSRPITIVNEFREIHSSQFFFDLFLWSQDLDHI